MSTFYLELYKKVIPDPLADLPGADQYDSTKTELYWAVLVAAPTIAGTPAADFIAPEPLGAGINTHGTDTLPEVIADYRPYQVGIWWPPSPPYEFLVTPPSGGAPITLSPPPGVGAEDAFYSLPLLLPETGIGIWLVEVRLLSATRLPTGTTNAQLNPDLLPGSAEAFRRQPLLQLTGRQVKYDCPEIADLVVTEGCAPGTVSFRADISGDTTAIDHLQWDFGDGSAEIVPRNALELPARASHAYAAVPPGQASLMLVRDAGCGDVNPLLSVDVPVCGDSHCPVITDLQITQSCTADGRTSVTVEAVTHPANAPGSYDWNFGDGLPASQTDIPAQNHVYDAHGTFVVSVTLTSESDPNCQPSTRTQSIDVRQCVPECPRLIDAQATEQQCTGDGKTAVTLQAVTEPPNAGGTYTWNFGDESPEAQTAAPTKTHIYADAGTFTVEVTLAPSGSQGCPNTTVTKELTVRNCALPCPDVTDLKLIERVCVANPDGSADGRVLAGIEAVTVPENAEGRYDWDFGDQTTQTTRIPAVSHVYAGGGTKTVKVTLTPADARCPPKSKAKDFDLATCAVSQPAVPQVFSQCCLFLMILILMGMAAGAVVFPLGLCALFSGAWQAGLVIAGIGLAILAVALVLLLLWLLWCGTLSANCTLVRILIHILVLLTGVSGVLALASLAVDALLAAVFQSGLMCGIGITVGLSFDFAYFGILLNVVYIIAMVVGCLPWWDGTTRSYVPAWLTAALNWVRSWLPPCPL